MRAGSECANLAPVETAPVLAHRIPAAFRGRSII